jgi:hypothetical protein
VSYQSESPFRDKDKENIGLATAKRLHWIGIKSAEQIMKSEAETIYEQLRQKEGGKLDICVLYQLRGAIGNIGWWTCKNER